MGCVERILIAVQADQDGALGARLFQVFEELALHDVDGFVALRRDEHLG
jgi:hypothetical protein